MNMDLKNLWKPALKAFLTVLALSLVVSTFVEVLTALYDVRMMLSVAVGAIAYGPVYSLFAKYDLFQ